MKLAVPIDQAMFELEIAVQRVSELLPHEEVIPGYLEKLKRAFAASKFQRNPVIVDAASGVILDGTHRWAAMKALGYEWIAVCKVDYASPLIELDSWARSYALVDASLDRVIRFFDAQLVEPDDVGETDLAVVGSRGAYRIPYGSLEDAFEKLRRLDNELSKLAGEPPTYLPRSLWRASNSRRTLLLPPKPRKEEVVRMAKEGKLMPPKSTRHIVPARPMGVNVPLRLLRAGAVDCELIDEILRQRRVVLLKPPVTLDREYHELLLMFI